MANLFDQLKRMVSEQKELQRAEELDVQKESDERHRREVQHQARVQASIAKYDPLIRKLLNDFGRTVWGENAAKRNKDHYTVEAYSNVWKISGEREIEPGRELAKDSHAWARYYGTSSIYEVRAKISDDGDIEGFLVGVNRIEERQSNYDINYVHFFIHTQTDISEPGIAAALTKTYQLCCSGNDGNFHADGFTTI